MGYEAVMALAQGRGNRIIATRDGRIVDLDMEEALAMTKEFDMDRYDVLEALTTSETKLRRRKGLGAVGFGAFFLV